MDGTLDVERSKNGDYRWIYVSPSGAMHLGGRWFRSKKAALAAGEAWRKDRYA